ncbi:MAG: hypothetical protein RLZZ459_2215 [Cyanobacteriota bacterium]
MAEALTGRFVFRVAGVLRTYRDWRHCPVVFDELIAFEPDIPPPPHTPEQHAEIEAWDARLHQLLRSQHASRNAGR